MRSLSMIRLFMMTQVFIDLSRLTCQPGKTRVLAIAKCA
jgi:hypothetical protein